jgi:putative hydrolase of the HAD superfamily
MIKAVFFDFGGTLADSRRGDWLKKGEELANRFKMSFEEAYKVFRVELDTTPFSEERGVLRRECAKRGVPESAADGFMEVRIAHGKSYKWVKGAAETMKALKKRGIKVGVVTNTDGYGTIVYNEMKPSLLKYIDTVAFSCEERVMKPDKRIFEAALERVGVKASEAIHVGDKENRDVEGAHNAGMKAVLYDPNGEAKASKADYVIKDLKEILKLV